MLTLRGVVVGGRIRCHDDTDYHDTEYHLQSRRTAHGSGYYSKEWTPHTRGYTISFGTRATMSHVGEGSKSSHGSGYLLWSGTPSPWPKPHHIFNLSPLYSTKKRNLLENAFQKSNAVLALRRERVIWANMTTELRCRLMRSTWNQTSMPESRTHWVHSSMEACLRQMKLAVPDGCRAFFEVRDARIPCLSHPALEGLLERPWKYERMICYTHVDLIERHDRQRIVDYATRLTRGRAPLLVGLHDPQPCTKTIRHMMLDFL